MQELYYITSPNTNFVWCGLHATREDAVAAYQARTGDETPEAELTIRCDDDPEE